jgi:2,3-dihydroxy-p-cumate/2,3-dihydroxybenzoate 3,4-dioxygenase
VLQRFAYSSLAVQDHLGFREFVGTALDLQDESGAQHGNRFPMAPYIQVLGTEDRSADCVALELTDEQALAAIESRLAQRGIALQGLEQLELTRAGARKGAEFSDYSGNRVRLLVDPLQTGRAGKHGSKRWLAGLGGVGLRSTSIKRDLALWTEVLGARIRDRVGEVAYLAVDDAHHRVALYPSDRGGVLYTSFVVEDLDALMRNYYLLRENRIQVLQGPGKETTSGNVFIRFAAPGGHVFALVESAGIDWQQHQARSLPLDPDSFCSLGCSLDAIPEMRSRMRPEPSGCPGPAP